MRYHEAIVVGGGLAGLRAAVELNHNNVKALVISRVHPLRSHSLAAQGGINAALGNNPRSGADSWEKHAFDTVKGSDYLADQDTSARMVKDGPKRIYELEHWGCPFSRTVDGLIAQRPFGGAGFPRTCFAEDKTGHVLLHTLYEHAIRYKHNSERGEMSFLDEAVVVGLAMDGDVCRGVIVVHTDTGEIEAVHSDAVIFATGGSGRIYNNSTNALISTALGVAIPYWAGVPLKDMEFIQFHPTGMHGTNILMTEGCRGEGGYLTNRDGERFLVNYSDSAKAMEVAPRDIVSRNITTEILEGRGCGPDKDFINLDLTHLGAKKILERLPGIRDLSINFSGIDPIKEPMHIIPSQHYTMGGIHVDVDGKTSFEGLYAAGECACVSVHGANRLGGNSLLETVVYGAITGEACAKYILGKGTETKKGEKAVEDALKKTTERIEKLLAADGPEPAVKLKDELGAAMKDNVGIFREKAKMESALAKVKELQERAKKIGLSYHGKSANFDLLNTLDTLANIDVAEAIALGALKRKESRGSHFRRDFTKRDDKKFLNHSLVTFNPKDAKYSTHPVTLGMFEPKERKY